jgi:hypothetical protein
MGLLAQLIDQFVDSIKSDTTHIYNEFSLQHELGIFMRGNFPGHHVRFERNVTDIFDSRGSFTKREIDICVFFPDKTPHGKKVYAIELKYPRNGQYPEQMFGFCKDIAFVEELHAAGFSSAAVVIFADELPFYQGSSSGIYGLFRGGQVIHGRIQKPTGSRNAEVDIKGSYFVQWKPIAGKLMYCVIEIATP